MGSFAIVNRYAGGTKEQYENTVAVVHPGGGALPAGQTHHLAGPTEGGWIVVALWDSQASWEKFRDDILMPGLASVTDGFSGPPEMMTFEVAVDQT